VYTAGEEEEKQCSGSDMHNRTNASLAGGRKSSIALCAVFIIWGMTAICFAGNTKNIMLTGFWPPTNEMLRKFSADPNQNPGGWQGQNWEGRGYDVYAYFPEFPGGVGSNPKGNGDFEVDYQDVSSDFWRITGNTHPVAILSYGQGSMWWEIEYNARNLSGWYNDYLNPWQPTPAPPDNSVPAGYIRHTTLPIQAVADAINNSGAGVNAWVDWDGNPGAFLCEYMAYHDVWYQSLHSDPCDQYRCLAAGFTHVPDSLSVSTATTVCEIALRTTIDYLDSQLTSYTISGAVTSDGLPLAGVTINGLPGNPVTDASGFYSAQVGAGWSGTTAPIKEGYAFNPAELTYNNVRADRLSQNYTAYAAVSQTIEFDATSSYSSNIWSNTLSWSHTIGSGNNRILIVAAVSEDNSAMRQTISSIKYNGINMTRVPASSKSRGYIKADLYYMPDADLPSSPGTYTVSVTYNGTVYARAGGAISLKNVKQQLPETVVTNSLASVTAISTDINTLSSGAWIVDVAGHACTGSFSTSTSTQRWNQGIYHTGAGSTTIASSTGPTTISWNFIGNNGVILHSLAAFAPAQTVILERTLTASSTNGGNVTVPGEGTFQYDHGSVVNIAADANDNYHFANWTGTGVAAGKVADPNVADTAITMDSNYTVAANFTINPYILTATAGANGSINPSGQMMRDLGQSQQFTAVPNNGYTVQKWYLDGNKVQSGGSSYTLSNIQADHTILVTFERLPSDNFDNNKRDNAIWQLFADNSENVWLVEDANRLNLRAVGQTGNLVAEYAAYGWSIDVNKNFQTRVDFHYNSVSSPGWVGMAVENSNNNYVSILAGADGNTPYFWYEQVVDGNTTSSAETSRASNDGTLYISYNAASDELYLSYTGYGAANAWQTVTSLLQGQWLSKPLGIAIGGGSNGGSIDNNHAYLDNFEVTAGKTLGWPPAADLNKDGLIDELDVKVMSEHWLESGSDVECDLNGDGIVNFVDFASLATAG
jgi:pyrrolidone-carboxylate peptidase